MKACLRSVSLRCLLIAVALLGNSGLRASGEADPGNAEDETLTPLLSAFGLGQLPRNESASPLPLVSCSPVAFPGAEGFGQCATGGRGGQVIYVTNLEADPNGTIPGSLNWALRQSGARYILFKVSGVIHAAANIVHGNVTLAGQTSPGGIIVRGLICDGHYEQNLCSNVIVRHVRSRPARHMDGSDVALDDALRLDGISNFIIDHCSFAHAEDEVAQVSWASNGTIQNSILAETVGWHAQYGGMLMNYSHPDYPQDALSIHHNLWFRLGGRLPEINCEASSYPGDPPSAADCAARPLRLELSNNLLWDPGSEIWYAKYVDNNPNVFYRTQMNWVNNYLVGNPATYTFGMILHDVLQVPTSQLYFSGNKMNLYPNYSDYQLAYCCNDFNLYHPNTDFGVAQRRTARHNFPSIAYTPTNQLIDYTLRHVGAFPRDTMDRRYLAAVAAGQVNFGLPWSQPGANDAFDLNFNPSQPPPAPVDTDNDGMPDSWEIQYGGPYGLNPNVADHNGTQLSVPFTGVSGYTNLEVYLNWLSDQRLATIFFDSFELGTMGRWSSSFP